MAVVNLTVYRQQRSVLAGTLAGSQYAVLTYGGQSFTHRCTADGEYRIDVTDIVRLQTTGTMTVTFYGSQGEMQADTYNWTTAGRIDPDRLIVPPNTAAPTDLQGVIVPPSVIIGGAGAMFGTTNSVPCFSTRTTLLRLSAGEIIRGTDVTNILPELATDWLFTADLQAGDVIRFATQTGQEQRIIVQPMQCRRQYAAVRWIDRQGDVKVFVWEFIAVKDEQFEQYSLIDLQRAYNVHNGLQQKMTLQLTGLTAYDYWYYSDIITSSDVRVAVTPADIGSLWADSQRVQVTTKNVQIPDGDAQSGGHRLQVEINYRRYDAI